jgi:hypothetical protein
LVDTIVVHVLNGENTEAIHSRAADLQVENGVKTVFVVAEIS